MRDTQERLRSTISEVHGRSNVVEEGLLSLLNMVEPRCYFDFAPFESCIINRVDFRPIDKVTMSVGRFCTFEIKRVKRVSFLWTIGSRFTRHKIKAEREREQERNTVYLR